jgi:branched-chain amino acid transport system permease protein
VRAATQDREMVSALGVNQVWLFTSVFALGAMLAGLGGALQLPREPANLEMDLVTIGSAFVVVVVGGMGSIPGAYVSALLIAELKAVCIWLGLVDVFGIPVSFSKLTLVVEFLVMAVVLVVRPWGLMGRPQSVSRHVGPAEAPLRTAGRPFQWTAAALLGALVLLPLVTAASPYVTVLAIDLLIAALFAASLHLIMGPGGMRARSATPPISAPARTARRCWCKQRRACRWRAPWSLAPVGGGAGRAGVRLVLRPAVGRLPGHAHAGLRPDHLGIVFQWDGFTGGSNGLTGVWPASWLADRRSYYYLTLLLVAGSVLWLRRALFSPFGYALRASRDSALRADAIGIDVRHMQWAAFVIVGLFAGLAGALFAFSKGSISPDSLHVGRSVDGLVMVLLGGIQTLSGPLVGAVTFTWLHDTVARNTDYWRAMLGGVVLLLVLLFPMGIAGAARNLYQRLRPATGAPA